MGQDISLKSEGKNHDLNHDLTFSAHTINCVCHTLRSMFRVLGIYNFVKRQKVYGDITQNASPEELETLLRYHENKVPEVSIFHNMYSFSVH